MNNLILFILTAQFVLLCILLLQVLKTKSLVQKSVKSNTQIRSRVTCSTAQGFAVAYKTFMQQNGASLGNEKASFKIERQELVNLLNVINATNYLGVFGRTGNSNCLIILPADNNLNRLPYTDAMGNPTTDVEEMFPEHKNLANVDYAVLFNCN